MMWQKKIRNLQIPARRIKILRRNWPKDQEAVIAAPADQRILLENEKVKLLDVRLLPAKKEPVHHHGWSGIEYTCR